MEKEDIVLTARPRRLRAHTALRGLVRETRLHIDNLVMPIFVKHGSHEKTPVPTMPGQFQFTPDMLDQEIREIESLGIRTVIIFGLPEKKDPYGQDSYNDNGIVQQAIRRIRSIAPQLLVISDVCFCQYTDHGHCGVMEEDGEAITVMNDATLSLIRKQVLSHARAGSHVVAPSGMMDGQVKVIRETLDEAGFHDTPILSYSVKYHSVMYGPFGAATQGAAKVGDRRTYQMDPSNRNEAYREALLDIHEGADMIIVKPAHTYLDIIYRIKSEFPQIPLAAYHVSGEYAILKAAIQNGWIEEKRGVLEVLTSIKRAGADFIFTYFAKDAAKWLRENDETLF